MIMGLKVGLKNVFAEDSSAVVFDVVKLIQQDHARTLAKLLHIVICWDAARLGRSLEGFHPLSC